MEAEAFEEGGRETDDSETGTALSIAWQEKGQRHRREVALCFPNCVTLRQGLAAGLRLDPALVRTGEACPETNTSV